MAIDWGWNRLGKAARSTAAAGVALLLLTTVSVWASEPCSRVPVSTYRILESFPHDPSAFTQGLVYRNGALYESTGLFRFSSLRAVDLASGKVLRKRDLPADLFGEGLTLLHGRLYQVTWRNETGFVYDPDTFEPVARFSYRGQGWGLTDDGVHLILSDGTSRIRYLSPETFGEIGGFSVTCDGRPLENINELEYVDGRILANVLYSDRIFVVEPKTGRVVRCINLSGLRPSGLDPRETVLNGIAHDRRTGTLLVTGKRWPALFRIQVDPAP